VPAEAAEFPLFDNVLADLGDHQSIEQSLSSFSSHIVRLREILVDEGASVLTSYDANGVYGHIDHVQVHEIAERSVEGTDCGHVEATISRTRLRELRSELVGRGLVSELWPLALLEQFGVEDAPELRPVDVSAHLGTKLAAVAAHSSQVVEAEAGTAGCALARNDTIVVTLGSASDVTTVSGTLAFAFSAISGSDCSSQMSVNGGTYDVLPCTLNESFTGLRTKAP